MQSKIASTESAEDSSLRTVITVVLQSSSLQARISSSNMSASDWFTSWPKSDGWSPNLPTAIAYTRPFISQPLWGFNAAKHPERISNLRRILENYSNEGSETFSKRHAGKTQTAVVGEYLDCVLKYIRDHQAIDIQNCRYQFVVPSSWKERECSAYMEAIKCAVSIEHITFRSEVEAGALWMIQKLRAESRPRGNVAILSNGTLLRFIC